MPISIIDTIVGSIIALGRRLPLAQIGVHLTLSHTAAQTITANGRYLDAILDQLQTQVADDVPTTALTAASCNRKALPPSAAPYPT